MQRHAGELYAIDNLHGREGVDVHAWHGALHGAQDVTIVKGRQAVRESALDADFGGAELPCLVCVFRDFVETEIVGVRFARAAAESAEFASDEADVGEVNVAVDDVGDQVAGQLGTQEVGGY